MLTYEEVAKLAGVKLATIRQYKTRAAAHRAEAEATKDDSHIRPWDLPEPDRVAGQSPMWKEETINVWLGRRNPGPGRPPRK